jgi:hypothetical protein
MRTVRIVLSLFFLLASLSSARADSCGDTKKTPPACSYTLTNGNCTITIDRLNPVTPPTIYIKPTCHVQVVVTHPYQFERLDP